MVILLNINALNYLIKAFRIHEWRVYVYFSFIGFLYASLNTGLSLINLIRLLISTSSYLALAYLINNAFDIESDKINIQLKK